MAVPVFVGAGAGAALASGSATVSKTSCTAGNVLIIHVVERGTAHDWTTGSVTNIQSLDGFGSTLHMGIGSDRDIALANTSLHSIISGRVTANGTCSFSLTEGVSHSDLFARIYEFSGVSTSTDETQVFENGTAMMKSTFGTGTSVLNRDVITNGGNRLAFQLVALENNQTIGDFTGETGGNWAEAVAEFGSATGATATLQLQTADMVSAGTIDNGSVSVTSVGWGVIGGALIGIPSAGASVSQGMLLGVD